MLKLQEWITQKNSRKIAYITIVTVFAIFLSIIIGPADHFIHGFYCDESWYQGAVSSENIGYVDLGLQDYEIEFRPNARHFAGFEILLNNQPEDNTGTLILTISDSSGNSVEEIEVNLSKVHNGIFYKVYSKHAIMKNELYKLRFSAINCDTYPHLLLSDSAYLPSEQISGDLMIGFAYAQSTFSLSNKVLIIFYIIAFSILLLSIAISTKKITKLARGFSLSLIIVTAMSWNYMYNTMDNSNISFTGFQADSEALVINSVNAAADMVYNVEGYSLGWYYKDDQSNFVTDEQWTEGYYNYYAMIALATNGFVNTVAVPGNSVVFQNGEEYIINSTQVGEQYTNIVLNSDHILTKAECGGLENIRFRTSDGSVYDHKIFVAYDSQYGLQGKFFREISLCFDQENVIEVLNLLCCIGTAAVFLIILFLIKYKYNNLMAICFFVTFWLSPWVVNFARNLYWVEFTWFLPMAFGLLCSLKTESFKVRIVSCLGVFISVLVKSLCGYEYISTILLAMISFLGADFIVALVQKDGKKTALLFRAIIVMGICALAGFFVAICIHADLRGNGDIIEGIKSIIERDVLRRTNNGDYNEFDSLAGISFAASIWSVFCVYFHFNTEIILGIPGNLFPILCITPLLIFAWNIKNKRLKINDLTLYVLFFVSATSWYILAKAHSYFHLHMNYVLWYFGFIPSCFYVIIDRMVVFLKNPQKEKSSI